MLSSDDADVRAYVVATLGWLRYVVLMLRPPRGSGRITSDGLRSCVTPHGRLSSRFRWWSGYSSIAALSTNRGIDVMGQGRKLSGRAVVRYA